MNFAETVKAIAISRLREFFRPDSVNVMNV